MAQHRAQRLTARSAAAELGLGRAHFYELYSHYLHACAHGQADTWSPGRSGGDHHPDWSAPVAALLTKLLSSKPASSYSAAASELHRRLGFQTDRASVRRWAIQNRLTPDTRYKQAPQLGMTPHAARELALTEKRSVLRRAPACPCWPYVWSQRTHVRVGDDGKVPVHDQRYSIAAPPRSTVVRCLRPDGDLFYLHHAPDPKTHPLVLLHCSVF